MAKSKDEPSDQTRKAGEIVLNLIDDFHLICNDDSDCLNCLYCEHETIDELEEFGVEPMRCFAYYIGANFGVDLQAYYNRQGGEKEGNC